MITEHPDLIDCAFSLGDIEIAAKHLKQQLVHADECGAERLAVLRERLPDLHRLRRAIDCLIAEAEPMEEDAA